MSANPNEFVLNNDAPPATEGADVTPDPAALQAQIDELNRKIEHESKLREVAEGQSAFWYDVSNKKLTEAQPAQPPVAATPAPTAPPELTEDRYNQILSDPAAMQKYVDEVADYKARIISQQVASTVADEKANAIQGDQRRLQTAWSTEVQRLRTAGNAAFGNAGDPMTDLVTQKIQQIIQDPAYANVDPVIAMKLAVREAEAEHLRQGNAPPAEGDQPAVTTPPQPQFPRTLTAQGVQQRNAAIAAQSPSKGRKATPPEKFSDISPEQMTMLQKHAAGLGLPVEKIIEQMPRVVKFRA